MKEYKPHIPTKIYTNLSIKGQPPNKKLTRLNPKNPINPQFRAPTITNVNAIILIVLFIIISPCVLIMCLSLYFTHELFKISLDSSDQWYNDR